MADARSFDSLQQTIISMRQQLDDISTTLAARVGSHTHTQLGSGLNALSDGVVCASPLVGPTGPSSSLNFTAQGSTPGLTFRFYWSGTAWSVVRNDTNSFVKNFVIDHPDDPAKYLVHTTTESPQNGVEYWGEAEIIDHVATVELPSYFESLVAAEGRQVQVSVVLVDDETPAASGGDGEPFCPEHVAVPSAAASRPRNGGFRISCSGPDGTTVAWLVKAVRKDVPPLTVEPLKTDITVLGEGPYRYYVPKVSVGGGAA